MQGYTRLDTYRYERKFVAEKVPRQVVESIVKQNSAFFATAFPARQVNNIYFDTTGMDCYFANIFGVGQRSKVRVRWYGKLFGEVVSPVLEFKIKKGFTGTKKSFKLPSFKIEEKQYNVDLWKDYFSGAGLPDDVLIKLSGLQPVLLNAYKRSYFESHDRRFRITVDDQLEYYNLRPTWNQFLHKHSEHRKSVIELKYDQTWEDDAEQITNQIPFRLDKNSKYVSGVSYFRPEIPV
ncbi:VTC domain-containing protein [Mariniphaga anaerophila]|uniref:VTC domain-containing protein n=1 Tax=Mariniphaga anaerophila TaxID=1484053 RepID=A0A1M5E3J1_9BACT|nr:VTC domain-containing protein [Mariniphaga anaerophila]SHF73740.1 VTC domain-containing protein [Mariniphaga anaerophila]